jgi:hypothetical protein
MRWKTIEGNVALGVQLQADRRNSSKYPAIRHHLLTDCRVIDLWNVPRPQAGYATVSKERWSVGGYPDRQLGHSTVCP